MTTVRVGNSSIHAIYDPPLVNQPIELFRLICSYLNPRNAIGVGSTNRRLYQLLLSDTPLWNSFLQRYFPDSCANLQPKVERYARAQSRPFRGGLAELSVFSGAKRATAFNHEESPPFEGGVLQSALLYKQLTIIERNIRANNYRFLTLNGHKGGINRIIVHDKQLISGSFDCSINIWDLERGQKLLKFTGHREGINSLVVYDNKVISGSFDFTIKIWDLEKGQVLQTLTGHSSCVKSIIVWNGKLFSGSWDYTIKIWDLENGKELNTLIGHTNGVNCLVVYKGKLVSCSQDKTIRIWDPESGKVLQTLTGHVGGINDIIVYNDKLISGSFDFTIKIWDLEKGQVLQTLTGHEGAVVTLLIHNGKLISGSWDKTIKIWDLESGQLLQTLKEHKDWVTSIVIHNEKLISSSKDKTIKIWNFSFPYSKQILEENLEILGQMAHATQQPCLVEQLAQKLHSDFKQHLEHHFHKLRASFSNSTDVILRVQTEVYIEALLLAIYDKDLDRVSNLLTQFIAIDPRNTKIHELLEKICKESNSHEWAEHAFHNDPVGDIPLSKKEEAVIAFKQILRDRWDKEERDALFGVF